VVEEKPSHWKSKFVMFIILIAAVAFGTAYFLNQYKFSVNFDCNYGPTDPVATDVQTGTSGADIVEPSSEVSHEKR